MKLLFRLWCVSAFLFLPVTSHAGEKIKLSVMTFNIENGGTQISFQNIVAAVKLANADIVGIQEAWGNTKRLAQALGWKYYDPQQHIVSKFPIFTAANNTNYDFIEVTPNHFVAMANLHLPDEPYGPDLIRSGATAEKVIANERVTRLPTALPTITSMQTLAREGFPVFITGDFNSPSLLDWTQATVNVVRNHHYQIAWPVTKTLLQYGFIDSFRAAHPDPLITPGMTWPSDRPAIKHPVDDFNPSANDLPDRLDFIFTNGPSNVMSSKVIENPKPWPSDHRAVVSAFSVIPLRYSKQLLHPVTEHIGKPSLEVSKLSYRKNEVINIHWLNAPANGYDFIRITPAGSDQKTLDYASRFYTYAKPDGSITISSRNIQGNWQAWYKNETAHWPLAAGNYSVQLVLDDGNQVLASTTIQIV